MNLLDSILDRITMYRLVLYYLIFLVVSGILLCFLGLLPFNPFLLILSCLFLVCVCWLTNKIFAKTFHAPTNIESVLITALILTMILTPASSVNDLPLLFWTSILSVSSKYILAINKKHIFNPAAIAVMLTSIGIHQTATWWIGTASMLPFTLVGLLIVRKIRRFSLVTIFLFVSFFVISLLSILMNVNTHGIIPQVLLTTPIIFFACIMLTEPLTTPPKRIHQIVYGSIIGLLFAPQFHIGDFFTTPEIALVIGNIYSYLVSPKYKIVTSVQKMTQIGKNITEFAFFPGVNMDFLPGQYMEWTLKHRNPDSRGNRRFFTIASSPTEIALLLGVKFSQNGSSFKNALSHIDQKTPIVASQLSGDFVLPKDTNQKLVFLAGGIGVTPYRSMIKYLIDIKQKRPISLIYTARAKEDFVYQDIFNQAIKELGIKVVYVITDQANDYINQNFKTGRIDQDMIVREVPDYKDSLFYLSGPREMVKSFEKILKVLRIPNKQIRKDYFIGYT